MKICFSTLTCPDFTWPEIYSMAKDFDFDGIEIRGIGDELFTVNAYPFTDSQLPATLAKLKSLNLEVPCLSSDTPISDPELADTAINEISAYASLASKINAKYIRVLGDKTPAPTKEIDDTIVINSLIRLIPIATKYDVTLLVETNGVYSDTKRLKKVLEAVNDSHIAALWDIHHPYRNFGESPNETVSNLGDYIKFIHVKDSSKVGDTVEYRLMGDGDMPLANIFECLNRMNYDGYVSLEWVYRWSHDLSDAGIVVPHFADYMAQYRNKQQSTLQTDDRGQGQYIWPKETLIDLTFPDVLDKVCEVFPDQLAFKFTETDYTRTYTQFREDVDNFARSLIALGVKKGDHVAIWATNVPAWFITFWATTKIGAVLVTVNTAYKIHEAEYLLRQSDTHTLVMIDGCKDSNYVQIINEICPELKTCKPGQLNAKRLPYLKNIISVESKMDGCFTWDEAVSKAESVSYSEVEKVRRSIDKHDICNMQYTSGTTGFPKGVMLTHYNVVNNGKSIGDCMDLSTADKIMIQVPMFHCFG
ncbi:MAG TPA: AMP-binding protein, partial [Saccharofermentans sp.]|nr:AMP-binding protein [Saccharofermentans sp.]